MDIKSAKPTFAQEAGAALKQESGSSDSPFLTQFVVRTMYGDLNNLPAHPITEAAPRDERSEFYGAAPVMDLKTSPVAIIPLPIPTETDKDTAKKKKIDEEAVKEAEKKALEQRKIEQKKLEAAIKESRKKLSQERKEAKHAAEQAVKEATLAAKEKALAEKKKIIDAQNARQQEMNRLFEQAKLKLAAKEFNIAISDAQKIINDSEAGWLAKWRAKRLIDKAQKQRQNELVAAKPAIKEHLPVAAKATMPSELISTQPIAPPVFTQKSEASIGVAPLNLPTINETPIKIAEPLLVPKTEQKPVVPRGDSPDGDKLYAAPKPLTVSIPLPAGIQLEKINEPAADEYDIKKILLFGLSSLIILALIISGLWYFLKQPADNIAQTSQSAYPRPSAASPTPIIIPSSLFKTDSRKIFELKTEQAKANVQEAIASIAQTEEPAGNFIQILFKDTGGNWPPLDELASSTEIDIFDLPTQFGSDTLKDHLDMSSFSFFAYSQSQNAGGDSPFNASPTNSGLIGLIIKINSTSTGQLAKSLKDLEQLMLTGLKILIPATKEVPVNPTFSTNVYKNATIRYINLPAQDFSLDYAILNDELIFATSKESMYATIDRILNQDNQPAISPEAP